MGVSAGEMAQAGALEAQAGKSVVDLREVDPAGKGESIRDVNGDIRPGGSAAEIGNRLSREFGRQRNFPMALGAPLAAAAGAGHEAAQARRQAVKL